MTNQLRNYLMLDSTFNKETKTKSLWFFLKYINNIETVQERGRHRERETERQVQRGYRCCNLIKTRL